MTEEEGREVNVALEALKAFLMQMRREHVRRHTIAADVRVPTFEALQPGDRVILLRSMRAALKAAKATETAI